MQFPFDLHSTDSDISDCIGFVSFDLIRIQSDLPII